ncbi:long-chain-acyl-CoA synthetase [Alsobacter sp. SYSU M60028]|uniref:Long-chain-acyl-CoA synthetase n=1 Tax=Alsobacter ponti TaxID=2962936 RepID=A0ABT1LKA9_9HYPH|nr:long-chain-acyl-CoA synthetase [Alsobacter ponti]MCP8940683.1 long-chain-acyl-CoA synthetase [Alsobacter ponti]
MRALQRIASELAYLRGSLRILRRTSPIARNPTYTIGDLMRDAAKRHGDRVALISDRETLTFRDYDGRANRYARWARAQGIGKGDVVALLMPNRPDYLCIWLGVARIGGVTALINTNLTGQGLAHCVAIVQARIVIVAEELLPAWRGAAPFVPGAPELWLHGGGGDGRRVDEAIASFSDADLSPEEKAKLTVEDRCVFIYTSGTTGLPKAANINHYRIMAMTLGFSALMDTGPGDRMYDCLPMYHSNGGVLATCGTLCQGGSVVIRERFSARDFWADIVRHDCTLFFYIGELCRYLVNTPPGPDDRRHRIRLVCGNGLRPDIWNEFSSRFGIRHIREFYAATEGNVALFNLDSRPGAVGRIPKWAERRFVVKVVKFDVEKEEPVRGPDGFCVECQAGEVGEIVGQILNDPRKPTNRFEGYADRAATQRKILRDAFEKGDAWFRSGDLMRRDADGYFYFVDRIGDTFRWKGENVATSEVAETISVFPGVAHCTVYGVRLDGYEGRAGMAAIVMDDATPLDPDALRAHLKRQLPDYARPLFLRIRSSLDMTGTFKQRKVELVKEGCDPSLLADPIYVDHPAQGRYVPLDRDLYRALQAGTVRL